MATSPTASWPGFSPAERDRRWGAVREYAAAAGLDAVLVPPCIDSRSLRLSPENARGTRSDCRFLTQMEHAAVVLPTDGRPPLVVNDRGTGNSWVPDARPAARGARGSWGPAITEALLEAGLERGRIGVSGLRGGRFGHVRAADGVVAHGAYVELQRWLPQAHFADATDVVGRARYVKSDEQVAALQRAAAMTAAGIEEMTALARPGADVALLYARMTGRMLELGSEYHPWALEIGPLDGELERIEEPPLGRRLQPMDQITNEVYAACGGLSVQDVQPLLLGTIPDEWKPLVEVQREAFEVGCDFMKPGASFAGLIDAINGVGAQRGMRTAVMLHSRGYGNEGPYVNPNDRPSDVPQDVVIEENTVWIWKPHAYSENDRRYFRWGTCVQITAQGARPLVPRPHGFISVNEA